MLIKRMFKATASRTFLAFALFAGQPSYAALPPTVDIGKQQILPKRDLPTDPTEDQQPVVNAFNQDFADALSARAKHRYAGTPVIGLDVSNLLEGEHTFGETESEHKLSMQSLYVHDVLERGYPEVLKHMDRLGRERMFNAIDSVIKGFEIQPNQPRRIPGVVCFINEPWPNGYYTAAETLDMLIAAHRCNPKYGTLKLRKNETIPFRPQALENALKVARNVAKIEQPFIDGYAMDLMGGRFEEFQHMVLVTYVEHLNVKNTHTRNALYVTLNEKLHALQTEMGGRPPKATADIVRREWNRGTGITAYFAAAYFKALSGLDGDMAEPLVKGLDLSTPLSDFVNKSDMPSAPAARVAPR